MTLLDYAIIVMLLLGTISGCLKGFLRMLATVAGLIGGLLIARMLYVSVAEKISPIVMDSMTIAQIIAFIAIWVIVPAILMLLASFFTHALEAASLGWINRMLGLLFGLLQGILVVGVLINVLDYLDSNNVLLSGTIKEESVLYYPLKNFISSLFLIGKEYAETHISI
ncbi:CvpA family protein [Bacteroides sp. OttesenSCG-928-M17]|nr:CvpA family protein [Bacteroides sp. OttesenSCG-928-M17]MDL2291765.1 CvpA family protein [Bacteroides sp. OttesenSCG-928-F21]